MSRIYDGFTSSKNGTATWFVKINDDLVHGPISLSTLCDWAEEGRITAGNQVSHNRKSWVPANSIPDLKMEWTVELKNGVVYGPFNILAAPGLMRRGIIAQDSILCNKSTNKELTARSLMKSGDTEVAALKQELQTETAAREDSSDQLARAQKNAGDDLQGQIDAERAAHLQVQSTATERGSEAQTFRMEAQKEMAARLAAEKKTDEANRLVQAGEAKLQELTELLARAQADRASFETETTARHQDAQNHLAELTAQMENIDRHRAEAIRQLDDEQAEHARTRETLDRKTRELAQQIEQEKLHAQSLLTSNQQQMGELQQETKALRAELDYQMKEKEELAVTGTARDQELTDLRQQVARAEETIRNLRQQVEKEESQLRQTQSIGSQREEALAGRVKLLESSAAETALAMDQSSRDLDTLQKQNQSLQETGRKQAAELKTRAQDYEKTMADMQEQLKTADDARKTAAEQQQALQAEIGKRDQQVVTLNASSKAREDELMAAIGEWQKEFKNATDLIQQLQDGLALERTDQTKAQQAEIEKRDQECATLREMLAAKEKEVVSATNQGRQRLDEARQSVLDLQAQIESDRAEIERRDREVVTLKASGKAREDELMAAIREWQKEMNNAVEAIKDYQQQLDAAQAEREKIPAAAAQQTADADKQIAELLRARSEGEQQLADARQERAECEKQLEAEKIRHSQTQTAAAEREKELATALEAANRQQTSLDAALQQKDQAVARQTADAEKQIAELQRVRSEAEKQLADARQERAECEKQLESEKLQHSQTQTAAAEREKELARLIEEEKQRCAALEAKDRKGEQDSQKELSELTAQTHDEAMKALDIEKAQHEIDKGLAVETEKAMSARIAELENSLRANTGKLAALEDQIKAEEAFKAQLQTGAGDKEQKLLQRIRDLEQSTYSSTSLLEAAQEEINKRKAQYDELQKSAGGKEKELAESMDKTRLEAQAASAEVARMENELAAAKAEPAQPVGPSTKEQELVARVSEIEKSLQAATTDLQNAGRQQKEQEARHKAMQDESQRREKALADRIQTLEKAEKNQWFLKLDDGSVYGPVPISDLYDWAAECRIGPDHEVSTDSQKWIHAKDVKELRMDWMVQLADGSPFGPINMFAAHQFLVDQALAPNSDMVNPSTGEKLPVSKMFTPDVIAMREMNSRLVHELKAKDELLNAEREQKRKLEQELAAIRVGPPPQVIREQIRRIKGG